MAHPNAKKPRIEKDLLGSLHIYVNEPPLKGKANRAVAEALAEHLSRRKNEVYLISGERTKNKVFEIRD